MSKIQYWNDWEKCCNWAEKDFALELKDNLKMNYMQYGIQLPIKKNLSARSCQCNPQS